MTLNNQSQIKFDVGNSQDKPLENALYIVPTPIGNLEDITVRSLRVLQKCDVVICEDTRVSNRLLKSYNIGAKKYIIYNENSRVESRKKILHELLLGKSLALMSDAGTPVISDPGYKLIAFLKEEFQQKVIPLPGACALTTAICASGIATDSFMFLGFLPSAKSPKEGVIKKVPGDVTFIFYESPNRVLKSLELIHDVLGDRKVSIARELTKLHEEIVSDKASKVIELLKEGKVKQKGEFVVLVERSDKLDSRIDANDLVKFVKQDLKETGSAKLTSQNLSKLFGISRKDIYKMALELKEE